MDDLRVPKHRTSVEVVLPGGTSLRLVLFLAEAAPDHAGPEVPLDLLNGRHDFIPALDEQSGAMSFLHRAGVPVLRVDRSLDADPDDLTLPTEHEVDVLLRDGTSLAGLISFVRPPDRSRLVDVLNESPPFFRLLQGDLVAYVNKAHVARVALRGGR
jgi:hypothetical protein